MIRPPGSLREKIGQISDFFDSIGHFRPSSARFARGPLPLRPKSQHFRQRPRRCYGSSISTAVDHDTADLAQAGRRDARPALNQIDAIARRLD